jgi:8-oxo-dGTP pyrophosphatase MutT (NUDIX family)
VSDPAAGKFEVPGGHLAEGEGARAAAIREWQEETGLPFPDGEWTGTWTSANGIYQGFVLTIPREADLDIFARRVGSDPDGDVTGTETIAWWDPADLGGDLGDRWWSNPALRDELRADLPAVMAALGCVPDCCGGECCQGSGGCCGGSGGCTCGPSGSEEGPVVEEVAKAAITPGGEGSGRPSPKDRTWPGWKLDLKAVAYWAPLLAAALEQALTKAQAERIAEAYIRDHPAGEQGSQGKRDAVEAATAWLVGQGVDLVPVIAPLVPGMLADAWLIGGACAAAMVSGGSPDLAGWQPGDQDTAQQQAEALGLGAGLGSALAQAGETASQMAAGYMTVLARALVDGAAPGLGAAAIGASLLDALSDPDQASGSVLGRLVTGIAAAAKALYLKLKVQRVAWQTDPASNACPECLANQAGGPYKIANAPECPAHIKCRCAVVPA